MIDLSTVNAVINSLIAFGIFAANLKLAKRLKIARGIRYSIMALSLYWAILYAFVAIVPEGYVDPFLFGQIFVRPAFTLTLSVMLWSAIYRIRSIE